LTTKSARLGRALRASGTSGASGIRASEWLGGVSGTGTGTKSDSRRGNSTGAGPRDLLAFLDLGDSGRLNMSGLGDGVNVCWKLSGGRISGTEVLLGDSKDPKYACGNGESTGDVGVRQQLSMGGETIASGFAEVGAVDTESPLSTVRILSSDSTVMAEDIEDLTSKRSPEQSWVGLALALSLAFGSEMRWAAGRFDVSTTRSSLSPRPNIP
jgi:hypothetical protein